MDETKDWASAAYLPTLTKSEMREIAETRVSDMSKELADGFKFLEDHPRSVTFFGSGRTKESDLYYQNARTLSERITKELGYSVISGGGAGIMEAANRGANEAGGHSLGLNIELPQGQRTNGYITASTSFYYFFVRKVLLSFSAEAFIFYPGGFGTMDEFFELLTLIQTQKIEGVPIICIGSAYWNKLKKFMEEEMLSDGAINAEELKLFTITDSHDEIMDIIKKVPVRAGVPRSGNAESSPVTQI